MSDQDSPLVLASLIIAVCALCLALFNFIFMLTDQNKRRADDDQNEGAEPCDKSQ